MPRIRSWSSPFTGTFRNIAAGELTARGADEMRGLGQRMRSYFPALLGQDYFPTRYNLVSTQVLFGSQFCHYTCALYTLSVVFLPLPAVMSTKRVSQTVRHAVVFATS